MRISNIHEGWDDGIVKPFDATFSVLVSYSLSAAYRLGRDSVEHACRWRGIRYGAGSGSAVKDGDDMVRSYPFVDYMTARAYAEDLRSYFDEALQDVRVALQEVDTNGAIRRTDQI